MHGIVLSTHSRPFEHVLVAQPKVNKTNKIKLQFLKLKMPIIPFILSGKQINIGRQGGLPHLTTFRVSQYVPNGQNLLMQARRKFLYKKY